LRSLSNEQIASLGLCKSSGIAWLHQPYAFTTLPHFDGPAIDVFLSFGQRRPVIAALDNPWWFGDMTGLVDLV
jgi:hypothetical protein